MKKFVFTHCLAALSLGAAIAFISCNKLESELPSDDETIAIEFQQVDPDNATRTEFHDNTIWWSKGDNVSFGQYASVDGNMTYKSSSVTMNAASSKLSASISRFNVPDEGSNSYYFSVFPAASFTSYSTSSGHVRARITTPDTQTPSATGFDPAADLLISNYAENLTPGADGKYFVQLSYYRQVALGKMHLKNLPSASPIESVEFSAMHDASAVTLAGAKWYDFTTLGPTSVYSRKYKLTLDYSEQNITDDMTAYFCCYPFELGADDSFTVTVRTKAGEVFTRDVRLSGSQELRFEADRGTQFTVNMSTAIKTNDWITVKEYSSSTYTKTANKIYYSIKTSANSVVSGKSLVVSEADLAGITDVETYLEDHGSDLSSSTITTLNNGNAQIFVNSSLKADSWYVVLCKLTLEDGTEGVNYTRIQTDWFSITAQTRSKGGITYTYYGANLVSETRNYRFIATDALPEGTSYEEYYNSTLAPEAISTSTLDKINSEGSASYYTTKYYTDQTNTATMTPGTNYTMMIKAVNARGETKFVTATASAGGSVD